MIFIFIEFAIYIIKGLNATKDRTLIIRDERSDQSDLTSRAMSPNNQIVLSLLCARGTALQNTINDVLRNNLDCHLKHKECRGIK